MRNHQWSVRQKRTLWLVWFVCLLPILSAHAGFSVEGTQILDTHGKPFVMRGVNYPYAWFSHSQNTAAQFSAIASTGSNTVRVVLSSGDVEGWRRTSGAELSGIIQLCKEHKLICVLEVHDMTGFGDKDASGATMQDVITYWTSSDVIAAVSSQEDYVILNIANEPYGHKLSESLWAKEHKIAIQQLRKEGLTHTLLIDAASWGQDGDKISLKGARDVAQADSLGNVAFSVHMYQVYSKRKIIRDYLKEFMSLNLPLVIGEFGPEHFGEPVDEDSILELAGQYGTGYIAWSWSGNNAKTANLDMVHDFDIRKPSSWGLRIFYGDDGTLESGFPASVYSINTSKPDAQ